MNYRIVIAYIVIVLALITLLLAIPDINEMLEMIIYASIIVITSIFTYGSRRTKK